MVGMLTRIAPISMPGTILSQLGMQIMPSKQWAAIIVSTESAMSSRLGRLYFMPKWPIAMPSSTPMVLNMNGTPPASRIACAHHLAEGLQVHVTGHDVDVGIGDGDERLVHVGVGDAGRLEQGAMGRALNAALDCIRTHGARRAGAVFAVG